MERARLRKPSLGQSEDASPRDPVFSCSDGEAYATRARAPCVVLDISEDVARRTSMSACSDRLHE
jgi:hypothetical protein